jgi:hypothetical protein
VSECNVWCDEQLQALKLAVLCDVLVYVLVCDA